MGCIAMRSNSRFMQSIEAAANAALWIDIDQRKAANVGLNGLGILLHQSG